MIDAAQKRANAVFKAVAQVFFGHFKQLAKKIAKIDSALINRKVGLAETEVAEIIAADPVGTVTVKDGR
jgi:hypothetical protein